MNVTRRAKRKGRGPSTLSAAGRKLAKQFTMEHCEQVLRDNATETAVLYGRVQRMLADKAWCPK